MVMNFIISENVQEVVFIFLSISFISGEADIISFFPVVLVTRE